MRAAARTEVGHVRSRNEDALLCDPERRLFVVADGMGGHPAGDVASADAIASLDETLDLSRLERDPTEAVGEALREADRRVREHAHQDPSVQGMGTTAVVVHVTGDGQRLVVGNVGDSRVYLHHDGRLRQITRDQVTGGLFGGGAIEQALGVSSAVEPVVDELDVVPGDRVLLCTDGLTDMLDDRDIEQVLAQDGSVDERCDELVAAALDRGGVDNVTIVLVDLE